MEVIAYKDRPISFSFAEILSHFAFPFYSCTAANLSFPETSRSNRMMTAILNLLMLSDQETEKNEFPLVDCQTVTRYSAIFFPNF